MAEEEDYTATEKPEEEESYQDAVDNDEMSAEEQGFLVGEENKGDADRSSEKGLDDDEKVDY